MTGPQQLALVGVFQGLFLIAVSVGHRGARANAKLALIALVLTARLSLSVIFGVDLPFSHPFVRVSSASLFLLGPLLHWYVASFVDHTAYSRVSANRFSFLVHCIFPVCALTFSLLTNDRMYHLAIGYSLYVHLSIFVVLAAFRVRRFLGDALECVSTIAVRNIQGTIRIMIAMAVVACLSALGDLLVWLGSEPEWYPWVPISTVVLLLFAASYIAVVRPDSDKSVELLASEADPERTTRPGGKYSKNRLGETVERTILQQIEATMEREKLYTDMDFKLSDIATAVNIAPQTVSMIINLHRGENFYSFVNRHRFEAMTKDLKHRSHENSSLIDIATSNGFRSKSTFHSVFRRITGLTPSQFREESRRATEKVRLVVRVVSHEPGTRSLPVHSQV